ncbi:enoyl-CoA hydratase-related protein [Enemella sp. A6]|uniref:enoyl-CoA hydratase-related protein n=1 Tax=Enemella sp. A6 TaxID=3440152 RepID=UPI003EBCCD97
MTPDISVELSNGILTVTLDRPDKRNAISNEMYRVLADAVERAETDSAVRVLVIRANGEMFTSGNDLGDFAAMSQGRSIEESHGGRFIRALGASSCPIVAAVQGRAVGIGVTMLLHCDYVLLAEGASLTTPFVNLALVPEAGSSVLLTEVLGHRKAFEMFALAEPLDAADAVAAGVANHVVPAEELHDRAQQVAERLAQQPIGALRATKRLMRDTEMIGRVIEEELEIFGQRLRTDEAREAFAAFAEKRRPDFTKFN